MSKIETNTPVSHFEFYICELCIATGILLLIPLMPPAIRQCLHL